MNTNFTPTSLSFAAKEMFIDAPSPLRQFQYLRPHICPFELLLSHVTRGSRVFDIGCGAGLFLGLLVVKGFEIEGTGIDTSSGAIATATKMARRLAHAGVKGRLTFLEVSTDQAWPSELYDVVSMIDVIHHVPPSYQRSFFHDAVSMVGPGGQLLFKDMCCRPHWKAFANRLHDAIVARELIHYVPIRTIEAWAGEEGLEIAHSEEVSRLWYGHELRVFRRVTWMAR